MCMTQFFTYAANMMLTFFHDKRAKLKMSAQSKQHFEANVVTQTIRFSEVFKIIWQTVTQSSKLDCKKHEKTVKRFRF